MLLIGSRIDTSFLKTSNSSLVAAIVWARAAWPGNDLGTAKYLRSAGQPTLSYSLLAMQCAAGRNLFLNSPCRIDLTVGRCTNCNTNRWDYKIKWATYCSLASVLGSHYRGTLSFTNTGSSVATVIIARSYRHRLTTLQSKRLEMS